MKLFFELDSIDTSLSDAYFLCNLFKFYQSQPVDKIYEDIQKYPINKLDPGKQNIFVKAAQRMFVYGLDKRDLSFLEPYDNSVYTMDDIAFGRVQSAF